MTLPRLIYWFSAWSASILLLGEISGVISWPEGTFGLPMPKTGCPVGSSNGEWETGTRTHVTEKGSHASDNVHLAGIDSAPAEHVVQLFCMKMFYPKEDDYKWMPGKYCIFKKGDCPEKFHVGYVLWDDAATWFGRSDGRQNSKGVLPDGEYNYNTKIFYCCRNDGSPYSAIQLPSSAPFYLLKLGEVCQEVEGMTVAEEWVYWSDEKTTNLNTQDGVYPKVLRARSPKAYTKLFYCYYQPKPPSQTQHIILMMVYVAAGIIGTTIITCVIICLITRLCRRKRKHPTNTPSSPEHRSPYASTSPPSNPPHVYRYITLQTNEEAAGNSVVVPSAPPVTSSDETSCEQTVILRDQDFRPASLPPSYEEVIKQMSVSS